MAAGVKKMSVWWKLRGLAFVLVIALLGYGLFLALQVSPPGAQQGNMARAFYYHFPDWIGASVFLPLMACRSRHPSI
jgi:hypothetical protein